MRLYQNLDQAMLALKAKDAEIERLNSDREKYFLENLEMLAEVERLREALRTIADDLESPEAMSGHARLALEQKERP